MTVLQLHNRTLDLDLGVVKTIEESVRLTTTELSLVRYLVARGGDPVDRDELHQQIWGHGPHTLSRALDTTVRRLRRKLGEEPRRPVHLITIHGVGYAFRAATLSQTIESVVEPIPVVFSWKVPPSWDRDAFAERIPILLARGQHETAARLCLALLIAMRSRGPIQNWRPLLTRVLDARPSATATSLLHMLGGSQSMGKRAAQHHSQALAFAKDAGDPVLEAVVLLQTTPLNQAKTLQSVLECVQELDEPLLLCRACTKLAGALWYEAPTRSRRLFLDALDWAQRAEDEIEEAIVQSNLATSLHIAGDIRGAEPRYRSSVQSFEAQGNLRGVHFSYANLAALYHESLRFDEAESSYLSAIDNAARQGSEVQVAALNVALAGMRLDRGGDADPSDLEEWLRVFRRLPRPIDEANSLQIIGRAWHQRGSTGVSRAYMDKAIELADTLPGTFADEFRGERAILDWQEGHREHALETVQRSAESLLPHHLRRAATARFLLIANAWAREQGRPGVLEAELRRLAKELPAVPGTIWEQLDGWR